jgi:hypothetical protein
MTDRLVCLPYADDEDLRVIARIIEAAIWYTTAERTELELVPESAVL